MYVTLFDHQLKSECVHFENSFASVSLGIKLLVMILSCRFYCACLVNYRCRAVRKSFSFTIWAVIYYRCLFMYRKLSCDA